MVGFRPRGWLDSSCTESVFGILVWQLRVFDSVHRKGNVVEPGWYSVVGIYWTENSI